MRLLSYLELTTASFLRARTLIASLTICLFSGRKRRNLAIFHKSTSVRSWLEISLRNWWDEHTGEHKMNDHIGSNSVGNSSENNLYITGCSMAVNIRDILCAWKPWFKVFPIRKSRFDDLFPGFQCCVHKSRCVVCFQSCAFVFYFWWVHRTTTISCWLIMLFNPDFIVFHLRTENFHFSPTTKACAGKC